MTRSKVFRALFWVGLFAAVPLSVYPCCYAESSSAFKQYESIKSRYLSLRNTDVKISKRPAWEEVGKRFEKFAAANAASDLAGSALFNAAVVSEQLFQHFAEPEQAARGCELFMRVNKNYPDDRLADDALVRCAELKFASGAGPDGVALLKKVVSDYPYGDMFAVANAKLRGEEEDDSEDEDRPGQGGLSDEQRALRQGKPLIVIDPGHGGEDNGAVGVGGLLEKDVVLQVALELETLLKDELGAAVRLTRRSDKFVPLIERTTYANDFEADLFVSLHTNASPSKQLHGFEVYYLDNTGDKASRTLADRENASTQFEGAQADLQYMLSDLIQNLKLDDSIRLAHDIQSHTITEMKKSPYVIKDLGVKRAPFYVLVGAHMPCVLVELSFIDHVQEGKLLSAKSFRRDLAEGVFKGIRAFLKS